MKVNYGFVYLTIALLMWVSIKGYQHAAAQKTSQSAGTPSAGGPAEGLPASPLAEMRPSETATARGRAAVQPLPHRSSRPMPPLTFPVDGHTTEDVISVFGDLRGSNRLHQGIDIKAPKGTSVLAVQSGFIERVHEGGSGGKQIYLRTAQGTLYYYAHLDAFSVEKMQAVRAGDIVGTVGDSGNAKGTTPHLHFEILLGQESTAIDPLPFFLPAK